MGKLKQYLIANFSMLFYSIFMPFFVVASVVFLVKLAKFTSVIQFDLSEMLVLYLFNLPEILGYLLPISFFISAAVALHKLSADNETIVIFTLGLTPNHILRIFLFPALLLSLLLLFNFYFLIPHTKILSKNFIIQKKSEAKFNLEASEFGYSFGSWLLFIGDDDRGQTFSDVYLFNKDKDQEILISTKTASIINDNGVLRFKLQEGKGYNYTDTTLSQTDFDTMFINDILLMEMNKYLTAWEYWSNPRNDYQRMHQMLRNVLMALFPTLSLTMVLIIGIVHSRHQNSHMYLYITLTILSYFGLAIGFEPALNAYTMLLIITGWLAVTSLFYYRKVLSRF